MSRELKSFTVEGNNSGELFPTNAERFRLA